VEKKERGVRLREIRDFLALKQNEFSEMLGIKQNYLSRYENGEHEFTDDLKLKLVNTITQKYEKRINLDWLISGHGEMFMPEPEKRLPKVSPMAELGVIIDRCLENIETQIAEIKSQLKEKGMGSSDSGMFVSESEPKYGDGYVKALFVDDIAAGPPIQQSEDLSEYINVPKRFIKTKPEDYYAARIRGESMSAAGIPDGCTVLIRRADMPRDGAIQVVRSGGSSTLKRMREGEDRTWTLHYEDNSGGIIPIGKDEEYQVQGDFVAVLPEK
jgi:SOS-response transcriptional repressor LexA